ncbi:TauD/TfdA family dioxygenase [Streptomyces rubellomurinus]|uniref:TauD/TfdA family dioxygenase n=1 Tax=Streptomyces rubellomurinus (strain ATCC 31215) TaxID=359131 RepID=UPI000696CDE9|nr:TauD/TfdA family dioxygenase [Streptomyces rubellomurinus]
MIDLNSRTSRVQSPHGSRRRSTDLPAVDPIQTEFLRNAPMMPLVVTPPVDGADLPGWLREDRDLVDSYLHPHGALLLRGFHERSVAEFEAAASAICPTLSREKGDLSREGDSDKIYQSTLYPKDRSISFHNESSHLGSWPMRQFFSCLVPARAVIGSLPGTGLRLRGNPLDGVPSQQGRQGSPWPPSSLRNTSCTRRAREVTTPPVRAAEGMVL